METPKTTPKDFFLYFGAMVTLYWSAGSLIALLFATIDVKFPDALNYYIDPYSSGIRFAIASLIIIFPICLLLLRTIKKEIIASQEKLLLPIRKWLYALAIFVTAATMAGDLIVLLNTFLGGEITSRFILKVLVVLVVSGLLFWYSLLEIRVKSCPTLSVRKEFLYGAPVLVLVAVVYGFIVMGSPTTMRMLRFDEQRFYDLQSIQGQVVNYWQQKGKLPATLADLEDPISGFTAPVDPRTGEAYEYILAQKPSNAFQLCAIFELPTSTFAKISPPVKAYPPRPVGKVDNWEHDIGRTCFDRTIDPELYPERAKAI